jgi:hypothetical protein
MAIKGTDSWNRGVFMALVKLFHFLAAVQFCYAVYYDFNYVNVPGDVLASNRTKFGGKFKFLTFLDAVKFFNQFLFHKKMKMRNSIAL